MFNIRRRQVITVLIGAAVAGPLAARAQVPGRRPLIAYLAGASSASAFASTAPSLLKGLRDLGYVEGRDFDITYKFADGHMERLPELADEVLRLKPTSSWRPPQGRHSLRNRRRRPSRSFAHCWRTRSG